MNRRILGDGRRPPTEDGLNRTLREAAALHGWLCHHQRPGRVADDGWVSAIQGDVGFPDWVLVHPVARVTLFVEMKTDTGRLTRGQLAWGEALTAAGEHYRVIRGLAELNGFIHELGEKARMPPRLTGDAR